MASVIRYCHNNLDSLNLDLTEIRNEYWLDWYNSGQQQRWALVKTGVNLRVPYNILNFWSGLKNVLYQEEVDCME
jgi:hypothetical protein